MKALKGLLIYVGLVLGIALGIGLIMLCIMYFFPSVRIAGYGLVHYSKTVDGQVIAIDESYELDVVNPHFIPLGTPTFTTLLDVEIQPLGSVTVKKTFNLPSSPTTSDLTTWYSTTSEEIPNIDNFKLLTI